MTYLLNNIKNVNLNINFETIFKYAFIGFIAFCLASWLINLDLTVLNRSF